MSELIAEAGLAMEFGSTAEDVARTCHAHPVFFLSVFLCRLFLRRSRKHVWLPMIRQFTSNSLISIVCLLSKEFGDWVVL